MNRIQKERWKRDFLPVSHVREIPIFILFCFLPHIPITFVSLLHFNEVSVNNMLLEPPPSLTRGKPMLAWLKACSTIFITADLRIELLSCMVLWRMKIGLAEGTTEVIFQSCITNHIQQEYCMHL